MKCWSFWRAIVGHRDYYNEATMPGFIFGNKPLNRFWSNRFTKYLSGLSCSRYSVFATCFANLYACDRANDAKVLSNWMYKSGVFVFCEFYTKVVYTVSHAVVPHVDTILKFEFRGAFQVSRNFVPIQPHLNSLIIPLKLVTVKGDIVEWTRNVT